MPVAGKDWQEYPSYKRIVGLNRRSRKLLVTTSTLLADIAAAAKPGGKMIAPNADSNPAASGIEMILYANAKNRFWRMMLSVRRANSMA